MSTEVEKPAAAAGGGDEAVPLEPTELERKIINQIEYYFGNQNLSHDKFLQTEISKDNGWVPLEVLIRFNLLKILTTDFNTISTALNKSGNRLVEVDESRTKVRRCSDKPLVKFTKENLEEQKKRSIFVKGFDKDFTPMDKLKEYFQPYGPVTTIIKRFYFDGSQKKCFKGSVFVVFDDVEDAKKYLEDKSNMKFGEVELVEKCWQLEHDNKKMEERRKMYAEKRNKLKSDKDASRRRALEGRVVRGLILHLTGIPLDQEWVREEVRDFFQSAGDRVRFVDVRSGKTEGNIRFDGKTSGTVAKDAAEKLLKEGESKLVFKGAELEYRILEGEEELDYWKDIFRGQEEAKIRSKQRRRG